VTHLPQVGLGIAFAWGVPMAFAAENNAVPVHAWIVFLAAMIWPIMYDTLYAMVDRRDDIKIGVKSTAILFGEQDRMIVGMLQILFLLLLVMAGYFFKLDVFYYASLILAAGFFCYQQWLIKTADPAGYFRAFLNNHWVGLVIFMGVMMSFLR
jgi:4-hydroxybenzoate polyprenyltransferase